MYAVVCVSHDSQMIILDRMISHYWFLFWDGWMVYVHQGKPFAVLIVIQYMYPEDVFWFQDSDSTSFVSLTNITRTPFVFTKCGIRKHSKSAHYPKYTEKQLFVKQCAPNVSSCGIVCTVGTFPHNNNNSATGSLQALYSWHCLVIIACLGRNPRSVPRGIPTTWVANEWTETNHYVMVFVYTIPLIDCISVLRQSTCTPPPSFIIVRRHMLFPM